MSTKIRLTYCVERYERHVPQVNRHPFSVTPTRFKTADGQTLSYMKFSGDWRLVHGVPGSADAMVGPIYRTKAELLADLDRYAKEFGF